MLLVEHRVNTTAHLRRVPTTRGVEVDVRDYDGDLRLVHDPLSSGERLEAFLAEYHHALIVFNVKCDGIEGRILDLAERFSIEAFFLLDVANPTLVKLCRRGVRQIAIRFSEYEPIECALAFAGKLDWVWVDCFTRLPLDPESYRRLHEHFRMCVVSPELQGHPRTMIADFRAQLRGAPVEAACTDFCGDWDGDHSAPQR